MTFYDIIFYLLATIIVVSAGTAVFSEKRASIVIGLFCTFMGVSGLFAILSAVSLAVLFFIFFGIMLSALFIFIVPKLQQSNVPGADKQKGSLFPVLLTGIVSALVAGIIITTRWNLVPSTENDFSFGDLSAVLLSKYSLPLFILPMIIFSVVIGAFYILREEKE